MKKKKILIISASILIGLLLAFSLLDIYIFDSFSIPDLITGEERIEGGKVIKVKASPEDGFYSEYYLFIPDRLESPDDSFLLVQPNNTGALSDDHKTHVEDAHDDICSWLPNLARELGIPLLVPCFDRPESLPDMYTHALDRETLMYNEGTLARIDRQLLAMVEDAGDVLAQKDIFIQDKFLMNGFSASGSFVNRFTALYPEKVAAVAAGGMNGMVILPLKHLDGHELTYQVGIADTQAIAEILFQPTVFAAVPQYYYMGSEDDNDALPFSDAYDDSQREIIFDVLGEDMSARWEQCREVYESQGINARFVTYSGIGHETTPETDADVVLFFKQAIDNYR
jgi:hypothetical protein